MTIVEEAVKAYDELLPEMDAFIANSTADKAYIAIYQSMIKRLKLIYKINPPFKRINVNTYSIPKWGNLYWSFMHNTSILIADALHKNMIDNVLNFPALIYNIDRILPCDLCRGHYLNIKNSQQVKSAIRDISFGLTIEGVFQFHNNINLNLRRPTFSWLDFIAKYKLYPKSPDQELVTFSKKGYYEINNNEFVRALRESMLNKTTLIQELNNGNETIGELSVEQQKVYDKYKHLVK